MYLVYHIKRHYNYQCLIQKNDGIEATETKKIKNHYLDKRCDIMKNSRFGVEDFFADILGRRVFHLNK